MAVKKKATKKRAPVKPGKAIVKKAAKKAGKKNPVKSAKKAKPKGVAEKKAKPAARKAQSAKPRLSPAMQKRNALLKKLLLKRRNEVVNGLEAQIGRKLVRETGQKIDSAMDSGDQSSLDMDQGIDYSLLEMKYAQYKDIADAFRKLEDSTFGLCEECGEEIDIRRLTVSPLSRYCISCKTQKEAMEKIQKEETRFKE